MKAITTLLIRTLSNGEETKDTKFCPSACMSLAKEEKSASIKFCCKELKIVQRIIYRDGHIVGNEVKYNGVFIEDDMDCPVWQEYQSSLGLIYQR